MAILFTSKLKLTVLSELLILNKLLAVNKLLIPNKISSIKSDDELIEKSVKLKTEKLSKF